MLFDARAGIPVSYNREAARIIARLRKPDEPLERLLQIMTVRREDGRNINLEELQFTGALMDGETVRAEEIVLHTPDGRRVAMLLNATPIRSEKGEVESYVVTMQDMVPLEERVRRRGAFLAAVSQELRTPLTSIKGSASALIKSGASLDLAEASQFHRIIDEQADHMQGLISDLLDLGRIEAGALSIAPRPSDLATLVDLAGTTFSVSGGRGAIRVDLPRGLPRVMADRRRIVQVLATLLDNVTGPRAGGVHHPGPSGARRRPRGHLGRR